MQLSFHACDIQGAVFYKVLDTRLATRDRQNHLARLGPLPLPSARAPGLGTRRWRVEPAKPANQPTSRPTKPANQVNQPSQPTRSTNLANPQSTHQPTRTPPTNQVANQILHQPASQPANQPTKHHQQTN